LAVHLLEKIDNILGFIDGDFGLVTFHGLVEHDHIFVAQGQLEVLALAGFAHEPKVLAILDLEKFDHAVQWAGEAVLGVLSNVESSIGTLAYKISEFESYPSLSPV
jgi:hypothetical protein